MRTTDTSPADLQAFYEANPLMVSSPFGGVDGLNAELLRQVLDALEITITDRAVLDVGCGRGFTAALIDQMGGSYTGADFVVSRGGFRLAQSDAAALPFADDSFDVVFCIDAMEHFPDLGGVAKEFRRVLKPGGHWFLSAPNYANVAGVVKWWCERFGSYERDTWAPFRRWQPQELEQPLTPGIVKRVALQAGFNRVTRIGHGAEVGLGLFPWVDHPRMPEAIQFRLQRLFNAAGPGIARIWPSASLHVFYRMDG